MEFAAVRTAVREELDHFDLGRRIGHLCRDDRYVVATDRKFGPNRQNHCQHGQGDGKQPSAASSMHSVSPLSVFPDHIGVDALPGEVGTQMIDIVDLVIGPDANAIPHLVLQHHLLNLRLGSE
jgi:hypothetical protein